MKIVNKIVLGLVVVGSLTAVSANGAEVFNKCIACHGKTAEKKALGKSQIIKGWETSKVVTALKGYKEGTYGGAMKAVMEGQVMSLSDSQIEDVAKFIEMQK